MLGFFFGRIVPGRIVLPPFRTPDRRSFCSTGNSAAVCRVVRASRSLLMDADEMDDEMERLEHHFLKTFSNFRSPEKYKYCEFLIYVMLLRT